MRIAAMMVMAMMVLTGMAGAGAAWGLPTRPAWFMMGFEGLVALTGFLGLAWARGGRASGLMLTCAAGVCLLMGLLGYLSVQGHLAGRGLKGWVGLRAAMSAALAGMAVWVALNGWRDLWKMFGRGAGVAGVLLVGAALAYRFRGAISSALGGIDGLVRLALGIVGMAVLGAMVCYAGHVLIRAFQIAEERRVEAEG